MGRSLSEETRKKISIAKKGMPRPDLRGRPLSPEHRRKIGDANRGRKRPDLAEFNRTRTDLVGRTAWNKGIRGIRTRPKGIPAWNRGVPHTEETKRKISAKARGRLVSLETRQKLSVAFSGEANPQYLDGRSEVKWVRSSKRMKKWRRAVWERDNYMCAICGCRCVKPHAHHKKPVALYPELKYDVDNGITLCPGCHRKLHSSSSEYKLQSDLTGNSESAAEMTAPVACSNE